VSYAFIAEHAQDYPVRRMCEVLNVSTSGYYDWRARPPTERAQANQQLLEAIREAHEASRQTYGSPRIRAALRREGIVAGKHRIARLMRENGLVGQSPKRKRPRTTQRAKDARVAPNLLAQTFTASRPNQIWLTDITYIDTREGWLYLAGVLDLYARPVVGWAMDTHLEATLVERALLMALGRRLPDPGLIHHSDRGSQFTSHLIRSLLARYNIQVSMSGVGNCYDNAPIESFFGTLKTECATAPFATHAEARQTIFEYVEVWYNRQRLHSAIGYLPPAEFEQQYFYPLKTVR
jgi:transposase InsO family protein